MLIRKLFKFENTHIVRDCPTQRCSQSIHGHSYEIEVILKSNFLDDAQMVYDFGLMKNGLEDIIDSFDHAVTLWDQDDKQYLENMKQASARWVQIPINPTAEQFSRIFFVLIDKILKLTNMKNNEKEVLLQSIIVHETKTGYAQCFREDAYNENMGKIKLEKIIFSPQVQKEWQNPNLFEKMLKNEKFENPKEI